MASNQNNDRDEVEAYFLRLQQMRNEKSRIFRAIILNNQMLLNLNRFIEFKKSMISSETDAETRERIESQCYYRLSEIRVLKDMVRSDLSSSFSSHNDPNASSTNDISSSSNTNGSSSSSSNYSSTSLNGINNGSNLSLTISENELNDDELAEWLAYKRKLEEFELKLSENIRNYLFESFEFN